MELTKQEGDMLMSTK